MSAPELLAPVDRPPRPVHVPRVPLRITLVGLLVCLVTLALAVTGGAATGALRTYLRGQEDDQVRALLASTQQDPLRVLALCSAADRRLPSAEYIACLSPDDRLVVLFGPSDDGDLPAVEAGSRALPAGLRTVASEDGGTTWRTAAGRLPGGWSVVVGNDLASDSRIIGRLVALEVVVGLVVVGVMAVAGYLLVRNSLRPLAEVERTARAIAAGDLSQRVADGDARTEVGRLSMALNGMLAQIEDAFRAQQTSEEQARASEARMRRFVADASHELRTPLTSIRGFAELYRHGAVDSAADTRRLMQRIEAEASRMGLLVEDLLQLARLDQQRPLSVGPVDLGEVAGDAVHDARAVQPDRPIALHLDESLSDVPVVLGDDARLRQVVGNLLTNALTHTPSTARVTVTVAEDPGDPDVLVVSVADEGPGMAPEDASRIFERFYRAESSRTRETGGTGLGLAIVAALVRAHGGRVEVRTAPGRGADFRVHLPRSGPPPADGGAEGAASIGG